jgi:hypothetical protein
MQFTALDGGSRTARLPPVTLLERPRERDLNKHGEDLLCRFRI